MAKEIIAHHLTDWSKVDEKAGFWGRIDLLRPEINFGIHRYNDNLWTSGQVGVGRLYDRNGVPIQDNGKEHLYIQFHTQLIWKHYLSIMLERS